MPTWAVPARRLPPAWRSRMPAVRCSASRSRSTVADHQNKADIGAAIARRWFDAEHVDMAIGFDNSSVALAVEQLAAERNRIAIAGAVGSTAFTGKACTATEASWIYDSYALTTSLAGAVVAEGRDTWFFLTVDYAFGHSLEADATARCSRPAARCSAASAIRSTPPTSAPICYRRRRPARKSWRSPMAAATWSTPSSRPASSGWRAAVKPSWRYWFSLPTCTAWDCRPRRG